MGADTIIVCVKLNKPHVDNCAEGVCSRCFEPIWLAPSSQAKLKEDEDVDVVCMECWPEVVKEADPDELNIGILPGVLEEIKKWRKENE